MSSLRKAFAGALVVSVVFVVSPALADPPGGGDKQCIPGLNGNPHPGVKGGTCPGR